MNIKSEFIKPENVYLIWELLSEKKIIKNQQNQVKDQISNYVVNEIHNFYKYISNNHISTKSNLTLIYLNKEYIKCIIEYVKNNYPNEINKIKIHNEAVTFKDIQEQKELEFNTRFNEMKNDFTNMVTLKKPEIPQFEDNIEDKPESTNDMEERIKEMTMKRNYDLQSIETNIEKNVSFENEEKQGKSVTDNFNNFFNNLDTYEEPNFDSFSTKNNNTENNNTENNNTNNNIANSIFNLQKQINLMQDKIYTLETKLDLILNKI